MKFEKWTLWRNRLYEIYCYIGLDGFMFSLVIADLELDIHFMLSNFRGMLDEEEN